jgi:hypothetical protein
MSETHFTQSELDELYPHAGFDAATFPSKAALAAVDTDQSVVFDRVMHRGEVDIIHIPGVTRVWVYWELDSRGLTVGAKGHFVQDFDLGSATISPANPTISFAGPWVLGHRIAVKAGVNTPTCELFIETVLERTSFDPVRLRVAVPYAKPWPKLEPGMITAEGITAEHVANIKAAPQKQFREPPPGFISNDETMTAMLRTLLWLVNGDYTAAVQQSAAQLAEQDEAFDPKNLLLAIGLSGQAGIGYGIEGAIGVYFTGNGEVGWFGSTGVIIGVLAGIGVAVPLYIYWTGVKGFTGTSVGINIGAGKGFGPKCPFGVSATASLYWSVNPPTGYAPSGLCIALGIGISPIPVTGYVSFGKTWAWKIGQLWNTSGEMPRMTVGRAEPATYLPPVAEL